jgi:hypothetical protein
LKVSPSGARQFFYFFKAVHADKQAASVGVITKRLAWQQKIAMFKIEKKETYINLAFLVVVTLYFTINFCVEPNIRPDIRPDIRYPASLDIRYPVFRLARYPAGRISGQISIRCIPNSYTQFLIIIYVRLHPKD